MCKGILEQNSQQRNSSLTEENLTHEIEIVLTIKDKFDAAHYLPDYPGACAQLHGHTFHVEVKFAYENIGKDGMCVDFKHLKEILRTNLPDHQNLNEVYDFIPTAENIAQYLYVQLSIHNDLPVTEVTIWESDNAGATYMEHK